MTPRDVAYALAKQMPNNECLITQYVLKGYLAMKYTIVLALCYATGGSAALAKVISLTQEYVDEQCSGWSSIGRSLMTFRQAGTPITDAITALSLDVDAMLETFEQQPSDGEIEVLRSLANVNNERVRQFSLDAWDSPKYPVTSYLVEEAVTEFSSQKYAECQTVYHQTYDIE